MVITGLEVVWRFQDKGMGSRFGAVLVSGGVVFKFTTLKYQRVAAGRCEKAILAGVAAKGAADLLE